MAQVDALLLQERLAEEGGAMLWAVAMLKRGLELPEDATFEDMAATLRSRDIEPTESVDWLVACLYDLNCFRAEMNRQLYEAEQRRKATRAMAVLTLGAVGTVALAVFVLWGKK
jgi:hypothetical protein